MTYSPQLANQVGSLFSQLVPGFPSKLASDWATIESGVGNNPYGVTVKNASGSWVLATYPTLQAGVQAAARLFLTAPQYAPLRAATRTGDPNAIASALVASPWNTPGSPTYSSWFTSLGYHIDLSSVPGSLPASGVDQPLNPPSAGTATLASTVASAAGAVAGSLSDWFTQASPTTPLTSAMVNAILGDVPVDNPNRTAIQTTLTQAIGTPINQIGFNPAWFNSPTGGLKPLTYLFPPLGQAVDAATAGFGNLFAWVPGTAVSLTIIAAALVLGFMGVQRLLPAD